MAGEVDARELEVFAARAGREALAQISPAPPAGWSDDIDTAAGAAAVRMALSRTWLGLFRAALDSIKGENLPEDPIWIIHGKHALAAACAAVGASVLDRGAEFDAIVVDAMALFLHNTVPQFLGDGFATDPIGSPQNFAATILCYPAAVEAVAANTPRGAGLRSRIRSMLDTGAPTALAKFIRLPHPRDIYSRAMIRGPTEMLARLFAALGSINPPAFNDDELWRLQELRPNTMALLLPNGFEQRWGVRSPFGELQRASTADSVMRARNPPAALWQSRFWRTMAVLLPCNDMVALPTTHVSGNCVRYHVEAARMLGETRPSAALLAANAELQATATTLRFEDGGAGAIDPLARPIPPGSPPRVILWERPRYELPARPDGRLYPDIPGAIPGPFPELPSPSRTGEPSDRRRRRAGPSFRGRVPAPRPRRRDRTRHERDHHPDPNRFNNRHHHSRSPRSADPAYPRDSDPFGLRIDRDPGDAFRADPSDRGPGASRGHTSAAGGCRPPVAPASRAAAAAFKWRVPRGTPAPVGLPVPRWRRRPVLCGTRAGAKVGRDRRARGEAATDRVRQLMGGRNRAGRGVRITRRTVCAGQQQQQHHLPVHSPAGDADRRSPAGLPGGPAHRCIALAFGSPRPHEDPWSRPPSDPTSPVPTPPGSWSKWGAPPPASPQRGTAVPGPMRPGGTFAPRPGLPIPPGSGIPPAYADSDPRGGRPWCGKGLLTRLPAARPGEQPYGHFGSRSECFAVGQVVGNALGPKRTA